MKTMMVILMMGGLMAAGTGSAKAGDQETACAAILCLAAVGSKPSECVEPLRRYYSISASKMSRLKQKRRNFLSMCPSNMPDLVNSLVNGQCNPNYQDCAAMEPETPARPGGQREVRQAR